MKKITLLDFVPQLGTLIRLIMIQIYHSEPFRLMARTLHGDSDCNSVLQLIFRNQNQRVSQIDFQ